MRSFQIVRLAMSLALVCGAAAFSSAADAAQVYSMTGKFARSNGYYINIPLIGNNPGNVPNCGYTKAMGTKVPGATPIVNGARYTIMMTGVPTPPSPPQVYANPAGCVSGAAMITATAAGAGKAFTIPTQAFSRGLPGMTLAVSIPFLPNVIQLATSFAVTGPPSMLATGVDAPGGTMGNGMNTAMFRYFHQDAWLTQTGRAAAMFTWCFGNPGCEQNTMGTFSMGIPAGGVNSQGQPATGYPTHQAFVKYTPGPNRFGGTMSHIISVGPNFASLAISVPPGALNLLGLAGMGSQPTGRGYADFLTDPLMGGPAWGMFMVGPVYVPQIMDTQYLVVTVMTPAPGGGTDVTVATNKNFGFPWTTGTVLARNTGLDIQGNPFVVTLTGMGTDYVTGMGGRNIQLVAGAVAGIDLLSSETPALNQMFLKLPEPSGSAQWLAAAALAGIAVWRSRRAGRA